VLNTLRDKIKTINLSSVLLQLLLLLGFVVVLGYWTSRDMVRGPAPLIIDQQLSGEPYDLAGFRGEPVFIYFWAPWCPICKLQDSSIDAIAKDYHVITIASWVDTKAEVVANMQQRNLSFPVIVDEQGEWAKLYGVKAVPASFFMGKNGEISFVESGYTSEIGMRFRLWWLENWSKTPHNK